MYRQVDFLNNLTSKFSYFRVVVGRRSHRYASLLRLEIRKFILQDCFKNQLVDTLASQKCFQMLQSNKGYEERNIKRIPKKAGVKVMEIKSILIKDTTKEERKQIVEESFGNISASCDGCMAGLAEMYQEYIDGTKEIRDINMEFNVHYIREDLDEKSKRSCPM